MSYKQAMKWGRKHPKGTKQPVIMSTGSGFWPAQAWIQHDWWPYMEACKAAGVQPFTQESYYLAGMRNGVMSSMDMPERIEYTRQISSTRVKL